MLLVDYTAEQTMHGIVTYIIHDKSHYTDASYVT